MVPADAALLPGVAGLVRSAQAHATGRLRFLVLTPASDAHEAWRTLGCLGAAGRAGKCSVEIVPLSEAWINATLLPRIRVNADPTVTGHLGSPLNFARFFLPTLLPPDARDRTVLYLDADIIVQGDVSALARQTRLPRRCAVGAVPRHDAHFRYSRYEKKCAGLFAQRYPAQVFNRSAETFNAGVTFIDLAAWQRLHLTEEAEWWMDRHTNDRAGGLWHLGSQPIMHLILHSRWHALPEHWNLDGLGRVSSIDSRSLHEAKLLHWTGRRKPWLPNGLHVDLFRRHVPQDAVRRCLPRLSSTEGRL